MKNGIVSLWGIVGILGGSFLQSFVSSQAPAESQQQSSIAVTMPTPKLPYNMPLTRTREELFQADRSQALYNAKQQREQLNRAGMQFQNQPAEKTATREEVLRWSHPEKSLKVSVNEEGARGPDTSTPVSQLLGKKPSSIAASVPMPQPGLPAQTSIPSTAELIANAGGNPEPFKSAPAPQLPEGVEEAPATLPPATAPAPVPEKRKGLLKRIFGKKKDKNMATEMVAPPVISTGPQTSGPPTVAPSPNAEAQAALINPASAEEKKYVTVETEAGTQFVIAGETANGQSGVLVPKGVVLLLIGRNGQWTTVKSPNGTIGSVQTVDIRPATFDESIQFITAESSQEESGN